MLTDVATPIWDDGPSQREEARRRRVIRRERRRVQREVPAEPSERWQAWLDNRDMLYRRCLAWTNGNATEAEDLLGQLLMRLLRVDPAEFDDIKCPRAWMTRVLRHLYVDLVRGNSRAHTHDVEIERVLHGQAGGDPAAEVWRGEVSEALRSAIDALPSSLRGPLVQRYIEGLDYRQIALFHDITLPTARKRCQLARDRIRQTLKDTLTTP